MPPEHKYARIERERRFLLNLFPSNAIAIRIRRITDYYIDGTTLRLREQSEDGGPTVFKLTQKVPARASGAQQGFITNMYLTKNEFCVLAQLSARKLNKIRYSLPPFGIDVFQDKLEGLLLAEAEFDSAVDADNLTLPSFSMKYPLTIDSREVSLSTPRGRIYKPGCWNMESDSDHREPVFYSAWNIQLAASNMLRISASPSSRVWILPSSCASSARASMLLNSGPGR
jgi:CYTH domain-containing protein